MRNMAMVLLIAGGLVAGFTWMVRRRRSRNLEPNRFADVMDSALIDASPDVVYQAVVDEHDGKTSWWASHFTMELREGIHPETSARWSTTPCEYATDSRAGSPRRPSRSSRMNGSRWSMSPGRFEARPCGGSPASMMGRN